MTYEFEGKNEKEAIQTAAQNLGLEQDHFDVEIVETQKTSLFKKGYVKIRVHVQNEGASKSSLAKTTPTFTKEHSETNTQTSVNSLENTLTSSLESKIIEFVKTVITKMGYEANVEVAFRQDKKLGLKLVSSSSSILIGKKGKNLDALQLLTNVYASKLGLNDTKVIIDIENYRLRREETIVRQAYIVADRVRQTHKSCLMEPMNPYERRLVHTTLNEIQDVETKSEGTGLIKQVRVIYKGIR